MKMKELPMFKAIGFIVSFLSCYLILSIPTSENKVVFHHVYKVANPAIVKTYRSLKKLFLPKVKESLPGFQEAVESKAAEVNTEIRESVVEIINEHLDDDPNKAKAETEVFDDYDFSNN